MPKVRLFLMGEVRKKVGWYSKEMEVNGNTIEDVLKEVKTVNGDGLEKLICCGADITSDHWVLVNGDEIRRGKGLRTEIHEGDKIIIMPVLPIMAGG